MRRKRALIVDDSETARAVLAGKLRKFEIDVDTRASAAAAIDYLFEQKPDAVFLDYEMPGMDGFQALKIIKSNPKTATIPVMMYTSREGGLALDQARALGAVGVLPKQLQPHDLVAVVNALRLNKGDDEQTLDEDSVVVELPARFQAQGRRGEEEPAPRVELEPPAGLSGEEIYNDVGYQLKRVAALIRREIGKSEKHLIEFMGRELSDVRTELYESAQAKRQGSGRWVLLAGLLLLTALSILSGFWIKGLMSENRQLDGRIALLEEGLGGMHQVVDEINQLVADRGALNEQISTADPLFEKSGMPMKGLIEWAVNQGTGFGYGENPFNEGRVLWLTELVKRLATAGFTGKLTLKVNLGDFCLIKDESGVLSLAGKAVAMTDCLFISQLEKGGGLYTGEQSLGFANYIRSLSPQTGDRIEIRVDDQPAFKALVPYPERYTVKNPEEWNQVAARNQRILVSLGQPDWSE